MQDLQFHYQNISRFILCNRFPWINNTYAVPCLSKLIIFFSLRNLTNLEDPSLYNYFYLFRFFFGKKSYITRYTSFYSLRVTYYSFTINICFKKSEAFYPLNFYINDLHRFISVRSYQYNYSTSFIFNIIMNDLSIFSERKTNLGLYNLKHPLNYRIFITEGSFSSTKMLLESLKLSIASC